jgi:hypothetical protein
MSLVWKAEVEKRRQEKLADLQSAENPAREWAEPIDIIGAPELTGWPTLTAECLPDPIYRYVMAEAERLNVDPCPIAAHVIVACTASISDAWSVKPKQYDRWTQQARIWSCVIKDVGSRGTEIIRSAFWPVIERDRALRDQWLARLAEWKNLQSDKKNDDDPEPRQERLTSRDVTVEAASEILAKGDDYSKLALINDELVSFLCGFNRYSSNGSAGRAQWLEAYDGGPQMIDRIKRGNIFVPNWSVIVAGNIQPRRLASMAKDLTDDGLFQRFMAIHTKPSQLGIDDDRPLHADLGTEYRDLHRALSELRPQPGNEGGFAPAWFDDEARGIRQNFKPLIERLQVDPTLPAVIRETAPKWSGLLARMALTFHVIGLAERHRHGETLTPGELHRVTVPTVTAAATFLRRIALPNLIRLGFETMPEDGAPTAHSRWLAGYILAHRSDAITAREIGRAHRPLRGKPVEIDQAMAVLTDAGWAVPAEGRSDGARWSVNPAVHLKFAVAAQAEKERRAHVTAAIRAKVADL